jgi:hypothetical protein
VTMGAVRRQDNRDRELEVIAVETEVIAVETEVIAVETGAGREAFLPVIHEAVQDREVR